MGETMKKCFVSLILLLGLCATALASSAGVGVPADEAVQRLKDGNARYVAGQSTHLHQGADRRAETVSGGQHPIATIIGCSDSRAPLELVFDQGVGDIFVIRVAGNVAGPDELGSVEYGVGHLNTTVVLVLGHTSCGAVTAAVQNAKVHGNIPHIIKQITPAVVKAKAWNPGSSGADLLAKSIKANVWLTMENILRKSTEVREFVTAGKVLLLGGLYDLTSGQVTWLGQHPDQGKIMASAHAALHRPKHVAPKAKPVDAGDAKADGHGDAKTDTKSEAHPSAKSDGGGELLAPLEKPAEKAAGPAAHAPAAKSAHP